MLTYSVDIDQELGRWISALALGDGQVQLAALTGATPVKDLNGGAGIADLAKSAAALRVSLRSGASFDASQLRPCRHGRPRSASS